MDPSSKDELLCNGAEDSDEDGVHLGLITIVLVPDNCWCCCCCSKASVLDPTPSDELLCNGAEDSDEDVGLITFLATTYLCPFTF